MYRPRSIYSLLLSLLISSSTLVRVSAAPQKPADLPVRYRDFKVYTTSAPDAGDAK